MGQLLSIFACEFSSNYEAICSIILYVKDRRHVSTVILFCYLGWLQIDVRVRYFTAIVMYNIIHGLAPAYLTYTFILNNSVYDHHIYDMMIIYR